MKRSLPVLLALSALSCAQAQGAYFGLRADVGGIAFYDDGSVFGMHATAGLEVGLGSSVGLFGEVQPLYLFNSDPNSGLGFFGKLNLGVNVHF